MSVRVQFPPEAQIADAAAPAILFYLCHSRENGQKHLNFHGKNGQIYRNFYFKNTKNTAATRQRKAAM